MPLKFEDFFTRRAYGIYAIPIIDLLKLEKNMLKKFSIALLASVPLLALAAPSENAYQHANSHASFMSAPEIDGSSLILGLALLGGVISLMRNKKTKK